MSKTKLADVIGSAALLVLFAVALLMALEWADRGSIFPLGVTAVGAALSGGHLLRSLVKKNPAPTPVEPIESQAGAGEEYEDDAEDILTTAGARDWMTTLGFVGGFFLALYIFGLYLATAVFAVVYLRFQAHSSWKFSVIYASVLTIALYLIFSVALELPVPAGVIRL